MVNIHRCMTPVQKHWEKRGEQIKNLEFTHRELEMEYDAEYIRPKDHTVRVLNQ